MLLWVHHFFEEGGNRYSSYSLSDSQIAFSCKNLSDLFHQSLRFIMCFMDKICSNALSNWLLGLPCKKNDDSCFITQHLANSPKASIDSGFFFFFFLILCLDFSKRIISPWKGNCYNQGSYKFEKFFLLKFVWTLIVAIPTSLRICKGLHYFYVYATISHGTHCNF